MSVGFGFSVGDFIAAVNLLREVGNALKDHGGARDDYMKTVTKLESTQAILSCVMSFEDSDKDSATVHAIHNLASLIQSDIERFLFKVRKYHNTLGNVETKSFTHGAFAKIKWSQSLAIKVRKLCQELDDKTTSLSILFDLHLSNASARGRRDIASAREDILGAINKNAEQSKLHIQRISDDASVKQDINILATDLRTLVVSHSKATDDVLSNMATKDDIRILRSLFETKMQPAIANQTRTTVSPEAARLNLVLTIPHLHLSSKDMISILQHFSAEVTALLKISLVYVFVCFKTLLLVLPHIMMVSRVLRRLPPAISLVLHDNITFEDALGRVQSLQFQQFKHWKVFETSLRCTFESVPGRQKVRRGEYILTSSNHVDQLTSQNWSLVIKPGSVVKMAIALTQIIVDGRQCPRGCRSTTEKVTTTEHLCAHCGLSFVFRNFLEAKHLNKFTGDRHSMTNPANDFTDGRNVQRDYQLSGWSLGLDVSSLDEETEELKAYKRVQLAQTSEKFSKIPRTTRDPSTLNQQYPVDTTGQIPPPGAKPRVTATLWDDEGTLCFQVEVRNVCVARREDNHFINGTMLLNVAGLTSGRRDSILQYEKTRHVVEIGPMHLKGVWVPFERALDLANECGITGQLYPLFIHNIGGLLYNPDNDPNASRSSMDQSLQHDHDVPGNQSEHLQAPLTSLLSGRNFSPSPFRTRTDSPLWPRTDNELGISTSWDSGNLATQQQNTVLQNYQPQFNVIQYKSKTRLVGARRREMITLWDSGYSEIQQENNDLQVYQPRISRIERRRATKQRLAGLPGAT